MLATYAQRAVCRSVTDRCYATAIGAPHAAMLALDLAIFDGGIAAGFLASRGSEVTLRSMTGRTSLSRQQDLLFSLSARRLDVVIGRLLPDGERLQSGERYLRALDGMAPLDRASRETARKCCRTAPAGQGAIAGRSAGLGHVASLQLARRELLAHRSRSRY